MHVYHFFASTLEALIGPYGTVRITTGGGAALWIERFRSPSTGEDRIALSHRRLRAGQRLRDPEILFAIHPSRSSQSTVAVPISFQSDITGRIARVHVRDRDGSKLVRHVLEQDLVDFSVDWFRELRGLGFLSPQAMREVLR